MPANCDLPAHDVQQVRRNPVHEILRELAESAIEHGVHRTVEFRKLVAYVLEKADGRDRREPWVHKPGVARPVPRLRIALEQCFGPFADLQWFKLNKIANANGMPVTGMFPRMAASLSRITPQDFGTLVLALLSPKPDAAILRLLHDNGGKVKGMGLELFSRICFAYRRDQFFIIPSEWGETSGCLSYIGNDLRKYCAMCRSLRGVCDTLGIEPDIRGSILYRALIAPKINPDIEDALNATMGPALARHTLLEAGEAHDPRHPDDEPLAAPLEFAARTIRARRGNRKLRDVLLKHYGDQCAITGPCPCDLLELAYIAPYPTGDVHARDNVLLLRADIHTLWDLNLLSIGPEDMKIRLSPTLANTEYEPLNGKQIAFQIGGLRPDKEALRQRWAMFSENDTDGADTKTRVKPSIRTSANRIARESPAPAHVK